MQEANPFFGQGVSSTGKVFTLAAIRTIIWEQLDEDGLTQLGDQLVDLQDQRFARL